MTANLPEPLKKLSEELTRLPSVGPRQAIRIAFALASRSAQELEEFSRAISDIQNVKLCEQCYFTHTNRGPLCSICADAKRDSGTIVVVEKETDLLSLENAGVYSGTYFVIGPIPKIGTLADWQKERLNAFITRIKKTPDGKAKEIILGMSPSSVGDMNAATIARELSAVAQKLTRLGRGLPTGGEVEFADKETLGAALRRRG
jgi:recombination protein RecR